MTIRYNIYLLFTLLVSILLLAVCFSPVLIAIKNNNYYQINEYLQEKTLLQSSLYPTTNLQGYDPTTGNILRYDGYDTPSLNSVLDESYDFTPGKILLKCKNNVDVLTSDKALSTVLKIINGRSGFASVLSAESLFNSNMNSEQKNRYGLHQWVLINIDKNVDILSEVKRYRQIEGIIAEPNYIYHACIIPNDPMFPLQWGLHNLGYNGGTPDADIDAPEAWDLEVGDPNVTIAILDSGVDWDHPDLADNIWINTLEDVNGNGRFDNYSVQMDGDQDDVDNDGNGFVDDVIGWDFVNLEETGDPSWAHPNEDGTVEDNEPMDFADHGTLCAGIAAAVTNNGICIAGVAPGCRIMPVRVGWKHVILGIIFSTVDIVQGIEYAVDNNADIISMSFGGYEQSQVVKGALEYAYAEGIFLTAAAGNNNFEEKFYPAGYDTVISVAASDNNDEKAGFSNYGSWIDVAAPGYDIITTGSNGGITTRSGTSMACPHVAGVAALVLSKHGLLHQDMIKTILYNSVDELHSFFKFGRGRLNAYQALLIDEPAVALLHTYPYGTEVENVVNIDGSAWSYQTIFNNYKVEYAQGINTSEWTTIIHSEDMVVDDVLASWDTTSLEDGLYTIRLQVTCSGGTILSDYTALTVNHEENTVYVDDDNTVGPWFGTSELPYQYVHDGVSGAGTGDEVYVRSGLYIDRVIIDRSIDLIGENKDDTILDGDYFDDVIYVVADGVTIRDITVQKCGWDIFYVERDAAIYLVSDYNTISNTIIRDNEEDGILLEGASHNTITNNLVTNNSMGININMYSNDNNISGNTIVENKGHGVYIGLSVVLGGAPPHDNYVGENDIVSNGASGIGITCGAWENTVTKNTLQYNANCGMFIYGSVHENTIANNNISFNERYGIQIEKSYENFFFNNTISFNIIHGVAMQSSVNNIFSRNVVCNHTEYGISLFMECDNNTFKDNSIYDNLYGMVIQGMIWEDEFGDIYIWYSSNNTIVNNTLSNNQECSIYLEEAQNNNIVTNVVSYSIYGIFIQNESNNNIILQNIMEHNFYGLYMNQTNGYPCVDNFFMMNTLMQNDYGVYSNNSAQGVSNNFFHNNFIDNTNNAYDKCTNIWDHDFPSGGNYWDDYIGIDGNSDGVGDTSYVVAGGDNEDRYPLMHLTGDILVNGNGPYRGVVDEPVQFTGSASGGTPPYKYYWIFGDGNTSELQNPQHVYEIEGNYMVTLTVIDNVYNRSSDVTRTNIVGGDDDTTPPVVTIVYPQEKFLYIRNHELFQLPFITRIIGTIEIEVNASDDTAVGRVEFYIDDELKETMNDAPYIWICNERIFGKHTITVKAFDTSGNTATASLNAWMFNFGFKER